MTRPKTQTKKAATPAKRAVNVVDVPVQPATRENLKDYGVLLGADSPGAGSPSPLYDGAVEQGPSLAFQYHGRCVISSARARPRQGDVAWLERHRRMTQLFVGLGSSKMAMVLGKPNHAQGRELPDLDLLRAFVFPPGHGVLLHCGTWHDFPLAIGDPVAVLTMSSAEVVEVLAAQTAPAEMDTSDVFRIDVAKRTGRIVRVTL